MQYQLTQRALLALEGKDVAKVLHNISTNDFLNLPDGRPIYACILNAQSKFVVDFFAYRLNRTTIYIDISIDFKDKFIRIVEKSRFLSDCKIKSISGCVAFASFEDKIENDSEDENIWFTDPRTDFLKRGYCFKEVFFENGDNIYLDTRIAHGIAEGEDLESDKSFILEYSFENYNAIHFNKGCYIGQEMITRTKAIGEVRKGVFKFEPSLPATADFFAQSFEKGINISNKEGARVGKIIAINSKQSEILVMIKFAELKPGFVLKVSADLQDRYFTYNC